MKKKLTIVILIVLIIVAGIIALIVCNMGGGYTHGMERF